MRKVLLFLAILAGCNFVSADTVPFDFVQNDEKVFYMPSVSKWNTAEDNNDNIALTKTLVEGTGSYSVYNYSDGSLAFALATGSELIKNGNLVIIDNNLLKYSKMVYDGENFEQVPMSVEEIQKTFPQAEIFKISWINDDEKIWINKPFLKKKTILLVNDTGRYFHKLTCKSKNIQNTDLKGLLTFPRYGFFRFTHYGERDGKLIFYVR